MTTATPSYGSVQTLTHTLASLASDTNLLAGRESNAADNAGTDDAIDALVFGNVRTGTGPTSSRQIQVWLAGSGDGTNFSGGCAGSDGNKTLTDGTKACLKLLQVIPTSSTSDADYSWGPFSVAAAFGGVLPPKWNVFIVHNTGVNLNSTGGNHYTKYRPLKFESA